MFNTKLSSAVRRLLWGAAAGSLMVTSFACGPQDESAEGTAPAEAEANVLTDAEQAEGWTLLFDGQEFTGWRGLGRDDVPAEHWRIEDGTIRKVASGQVPVAADGQPMQGGDLMTEEAYEDFELVFDWKVTEGANSGVKYNVSEEMSTANPPQHAALGFEYQVIDDSKHADAENPTHRTGSLYDMIAAPESKPMKPAGEWNTSRIVFNGQHGEHWLNGEKLLEYDLDSSRFDSLLAASKYRDIGGFGDKRSGHIVLQDHNDEVWYRNVKIRRLSPQ